MRIIAACLLALTVATSAKAANVDWKMYGTASPDDGPAVCFYDAQGVAQTSDRHVRVWTKCLLQKALDAVNIESDFDGRIMKNAARKMIDKYVPPIALVVENIDYDQAMGITAYEETADISGIQPYAQFFYELSCSERMIRRLSTYIKAGGKEGYDKKPSSWEYVPPEGSAATLLKILCPMQ